jgi:hypothetical protein
MTFILSSPYYSTIVVFVLVQWALFVFFCCSLPKTTQISEVANYVHLQMYLEKLGSILECFETSLELL